MNSEQRSSLVSLVFQLHTIVISKNFYS